MGSATEEVRPPGWWFPARITGYFLAVAALCLGAMAVLGLGELRDANTENSSVRIDRAGRAAAALFNERVAGTATVADANGSPQGIVLESELALAPDASWDALLDTVGGINQGAANLFRFNAESASFDRLSTTFRTPEGERVGGSQVEPGLIGSSHPAYAAVTEGRPHIGEVPVAGRYRLAYLTPLLSESGETVGILAVDVGWVDDLERINSTATRRAVQAAVVLMALLAAVCVIVMLLSFRPLRRLTDLAHEIGASASTAPTSLTHRRDEIGYLAKGLEKVVDLQESLRIRAFADDLTGIANRAALLDELERRFDVIASEPSKGFALLIIDLDGFKEVNDGLGHQAGDEVLVSFTAELEGRLRDGEFMARLGGDEFAVITTDMSVDRLAVNELGGRIHEAAAALFATSAGDVRIAASIGIALAPTHGETTTDLISHADLALYDAKRNGGGISRQYKPAFTETFQRRIRLARDLRQIVDEGFDVDYQPIYGADGTLVAAEALARWNHPEYGAVPPGEFIPIAESHALIDRLSERVLDDACARVARWNRLGGPDGMAVNVNVSTLQLSNRQFPSLVQRMLHAYDLPPERLCLELTEGLLIPDANHPHRTVLNELVELGVQVAIDDFGTGYSALTYLHELPVHQVKIDRSFVATATTNGRQAELLSTIVRLAHNLQLNVVLEGIETDDHVRLAIANGADRMQGYLLGRPMRPDAFVELLGRPTLELPDAIGPSDIRGLVR
ncbi:MAG: EAL domain-containing protein [Actinomycetota bacterium]